MKPRIAIGMNYHGSQEGVERAYLDRPYFEMVTACQAIPCPVLPIPEAGYIDSQLDQADGVLLTGGRDLNPRLWAEVPHPQTVLVHPQREAFDFMLYERARQRQMPILGICLGLQVIAVAHGGALHQHLPDHSSQVDHGKSGKEVWHDLTLKPSQFRSFPGIDGQNRIGVPSLHHQGVVRIGAGLTVAGVTDDGIIEVVEGTGYPFLLAVQWHPERHFTVDSVCQSIVSAFLQACKSDLS